MQCPFYKPGKRPDAAADKLSQTGLKTQLRKISQTLSHITNLVDQKGCAADPLPASGRHSPQPPAASPTVRGPARSVRGQRQAAAAARSRLHRSRRRRPACRHRRPRLRAPDCRRRSRPPETRHRQPRFVRSLTPSRGSPLDSLRGESLGFAPPSLIPGWPP